MEVLTAKNIHTVKVGDRLEFACGGRDKVTTRNGKLLVFGKPIEEVFGRVLGEVVYIDRFSEVRSESKNS